tara:strand:+ start:220599 stop:221648 length:1050 start_codon:yes stop_codon:yes gene_type:complete
MPEEKPEDFIYSAVPMSKKESVARSAEARVTETVKSAVQHHLASFLDPKGKHRNLVNLAASFSVQYETRISGPRDLDDPSIYEVQLARLWQELRQRLPCIIIVDTGFAYQNPGLGGLVDSWPVSRSTSGVSMSMLATVPIELQIAAMDQTSCGDLRDVLSLILGPLTHFTKSHVIRSLRGSDKWEVRLPLEPQQAGLESRNVGDDSKDTLYVTSISLETVFEGIIPIGFDNQIQREQFNLMDNYDGVNPVGFRYEDGSVGPLRSCPSVDTIEVPSSVCLNQHAKITADWLPVHSRFISDDPKIALVDGQRKSIIPKRPGTFNLILMDYTPGLAGGPKPLKTWPIRVMLG